MYSVVKYKKPETLYVTGNKSLIQNDFDTAIPVHGQVSILYFGFLRPTRVMGKNVCLCNGQHSGTNVHFTHLLLTVISFVVTPNSPPTITILLFKPFNS